MYYFLFDSSFTSTAGFQGAPMMWRMVVRVFRLTSEVYLMIPLFNLSTPAGEILRQYGLQFNAEFFFYEKCYFQLK